MRVDRFGSGIRIERVSFIIITQIIECTLILLKIIIDFLIKTIVSKLRVLVSFT